MLACGRPLRRWLANNPGAPPAQLVHSSAHTACRILRKRLTEKGLLHDVTAFIDVDNSGRAHTFYVICTFVETRQALL
jgi:hypothetical protein